MSASDSRRDARYRHLGYVILPRCIADETIAQLREMVSSMDLRARKPNLLQNARLHEAVDRLFPPLFLNMGVVVKQLVELHALVAVEGHPMRLGWHKDRPVGGGMHTFQLPLLGADVFHELVPGSHARELTDPEVAARNAGGATMPGAMRIELNIGDTLLRRADILHRGHNPAGNKRLTLVGTYA